MTSPCEVLEEARRLIKKLGITHDQFAASLPLPKKPHRVTVARWLNTSRPNWHCPSGQAIVAVMQWIQQQKTANKPQTIK
jgi:hypothetical protein